MPVRALEEGEYETYLGVPMVTRLTFRPTRDLKEKTNTRFYKCGPNTWTRTRKAATRLHVRIDVSSNNFLFKVIADVVSCVSVKAVRGLRTVIRRRWTTELANASNQGRVAKGLLLI